MPAPGAGATRRLCPDRGGGWPPPPRRLGRPGSAPGPAGVTHYRHAPADLAAPLRAVHGRGAPHGPLPVAGVRFKPNRELPPAAEGIESPYDVEARYRHKRDTSWTGYMVHVSETCEPTAPHLLTHVHTTPASVHEAQCTEPIQQA